MHIVQWAWETLCKNGTVKDVISAEAGCFRFTVENCPCRIFILRKNWADGYSLSIKADLPNRKEHLLMATASDTELSLYEQRRMLDRIFRTVKATVLTDYTVELADRNEA